MTQSRPLVMALLAAAACSNSPGKQPVTIDAFATHDDAMADAPPDSAPPANVLDDGFGTHGSVALPSGVACIALALDASDRPILVAAGPNLPATLSRYTAAGALDPTFGAGGSVYVANGATLLGRTNAFTLASGKIAVTATYTIDATHYAPHLYRFTSAGVPELDLELPLTTSSWALLARERADGDLEVVTIGTAGGHAFSIVRITAAGALDATFGDNGVLAVDTSAYNVNPGYFPHGIAVADGTFVLTGASFGMVGQGVGPINGHVFRVEDSAITAHVETDNAQFFSIVDDGAKPVVFVTSFPSNHGTIEAIDAVSLQPDLSTAFPFSVAAEGIYGPFSGAALAIAGGTEMVVAQPANSMMMLARYRDDAAHESRESGLVAASASDYCGAALDSQARPVLASQNALYRFAP